MNRIYLILFTILTYSCYSCNNTGNAGVRVNDGHKFDSAAMVRQIEEEAKPAYVEAYKKVQSVRSSINLADSGLLEKKDVVAEYNSVLGPEMGVLKTFSQVKERIDTAGDGYIQMKFYKAAAEIARGKAAEKHFEADAIRADSVR